MLLWLETHRVSVFVTGAEDTDIKLHFSHIIPTCYSLQRGPKSPQITNSSRQNIGSIKAQSPSAFFHCLGSGPQVSTPSYSPGQVPAKVGPLSFCHTTQLSLLHPHLLSLHGTRVRALPGSCWGEDREEGGPGGRERSAMEHGGRTDQTRPECQAW